MNAKLKTIGKSALLLIVSVYAALWLVEGMARLVFHGTLFAPASENATQVRHPTRGAALPMNAKMGMFQLAYSNIASTNSMGFRGEEITQLPEPGMTRILLLSDSNGFGSGVGDDETLAVQLEKTLGPEKFEVLNFSVPAYSSVQEYIWLVEEGLDMKPDLVLLGFTPSNDIQTNYQPLQALYQNNSKRPYAVLDAVGNFTIDGSFMTAFTEKTKRKSPFKYVLNFFVGPLVQSLAVQAYENTIGGGKSDPNIWIGWPFLKNFSDVYALKNQNSEQYEKLWRGAWAVTQAVIKAMRDKSQQSGARFVMFSHTSKIEGNPDHLASLQSAYPELVFDMSKPEAELKAFAMASDIPMVSASKAIRSAAALGARDLYFYIDDDHMTAKGYAIAGKALADDLTAQGLLPVK